MISKSNVLIRSFALYESILHTSDEGSSDGFFCFHRRISDLLFCDYYGLPNIIGNKTYHFTQIFKRR